MSKFTPFNFRSALNNFILFFFLLSYASKAQTFTDSNLPIVIITTDLNANNQPLEILDDPKILASMKIIKRPDGSRNYMSDQNTSDYLNYNGRIGIEIRGSSSQSLPKKAYALTTLKADNVSNNNVSILGMPSENDWILNGLAFDPSLIRDYLSYNLSRQIGNYATRTVYCEVVINGDYRGLYVMQEKIKSGTNRVNVTKIASTDNTEPNLSGGYITKADKDTGGDPIAWTMSSYAGSTNFIHELPKPSAVTPQQNTYIYNQFLNLQATASASNASVVNGFPSVIDVPSFVDFMLINEIASNPDAYQFSTFFHKDRGGKLKAGPIWDFNLTYGNDLFLWGFNRSHTDVWQFANGDNEGAKFWKDLFNNSTYKCNFAKRWNQLTQTGQPLNYASLTQFIDQTVSLIAEAKIREEQRWSTTNYPSVQFPTTEINNLKTWLSTRISWMTTNLGSFSSCSSSVAPSLVINRINYNPQAATTTLSDGLEFVSIKNTGSTTVNLAGYYFKELGISYQFPSNSTIIAGGTIHLASNPAAFQTKYGVVAYGQFSRNLSNSSQKIILADAFGNTIDSVEYFDVAPWPTEADGAGSYLQLINTSLDNNLATSWIISNKVNLTANNVIDCDDVRLTQRSSSPKTLNIHSNETMSGFKVFNAAGDFIFEKKQKSVDLNIDWTKYPKGTYFVTIYNKDGQITKKIENN
jgi:spore coat protein CotH